MLDKRLHQGTMTVALHTCAHAQADEHSPHQNNRLYYADNLFPLHSCWGTVQSSFVTCNCVNLRLDSWRGALAPQAMQDEVNVFLGFLGLAVRVHPSINIQCLQNQQMINTLCPVCA